jgi:2-octaprenyl-6-methoxyphenol hydroxylase
MTERVDVLIAGAGFAGLGLAIALKQALGPSLDVVVVDPALTGEPSRDPRASAIAAAARRLFEQVEVWDAEALQAQPILDMVVTDSRDGDVHRPTFLTFDGEVAPGEPFAHMVENRFVLDALAARARALGVGLIAGRATGYAPGPAAATIALADGSRYAARLAVAADGGKSVLRGLAGISTTGWDYGQSGLVCTVRHERDHQGRAEEHFLPAGPFAILPLRGNRSSIVWTERTARADRLATMPEILFLEELEQVFGLKLGDISVEGQRRAFPLGLWIARSFIADRLALIGDAAHVIHPIAGQGLNMGLRDVAALAESVVDAMRLGLDPGAPDVLERYQAWRRFDTVAMGIATDGLNRLFSNRSGVLRLARDVGLGIVDRLPGVKSFFIREAAGLTGTVPKLLRGEAL